MLRPHPRRRDPERRRRAAEQQAQAQARYAQGAAPVPAVRGTVRREGDKASCAAVQAGAQKNAPTRKPEVYQEIVKKPLLNTNFRPKADPEDPEKAQKIFQANPTSGRLGFTSYSEDSGDTDAVIKAILTNN